MLSSSLICVCESFIFNRIIYWKWCNIIKVDGQWPDRVATRATTAATRSSIVQKSSKVHQRRQGITSAVLANHRRRRRLRLVAPIIIITTTTTTTTTSKVQQPHHRLRPFQPTNSKRKRFSKKPLTLLWAVSLNIVKDTAVVSWYRFLKKVCKYNTIFETPAIRVEWNLRRLYRRPLLDNQVRSAGYFPRARWNRRNQELITAENLITVHHLFFVRSAFNRAPRRSHAEKIQSQQ